jgi:hypothetical protein
MSMEVVDSEGNTYKVSSYVEGKKGRAHGYIIKI